MNVSGEIASLVAVSCLRCNLVSCLAIWVACMGYNCASGPFFALSSYSAYFTLKNRCMFRLYLHLGLVCRFLLPFGVLCSQKVTNASARIAFLAGLVSSPFFGGVCLPNPCVLASKRHVFYEAFDASVDDQEMHVFYCAFGTLRGVR